MKILFWLHILVFSVLAIASVRCNSDVVDSEENINNNTILIRCSKGLKRVNGVCIRKKIEIGILRDYLCPLIS